VPGNCRVSNERVKGAVPPAKGKWLLKGCDELSKDMKYLKIKEVK